jgi:hypothetical protein
MRKYQNQRKYKTKGISLKKSTNRNPAFVFNRKNTFRATTRIIMARHQELIINITIA